MELDPGIPGMHHYSMDTMCWCNHAGASRVWSPARPAVPRDVTGGLGRGSASWPLVCEVRSKLTPALTHSLPPARLSSPWPRVRAAIPEDRRIWGPGQGHIKGGHRMRRKYTGHGRIHPTYLRLPTNEFFVSLQHQEMVTLKYFID